MELDLFKPLYKLHRRGQGPPSDCFDTQNPREAIGEYRIAPDSAPAFSGLGRAYAAYGLEPPNNTPVVWRASTGLEGLRIVSGLLTPELQCALVRESVTDYLQTPLHRSNLDAHHTLERPINLFGDAEPSATLTLEQMRIRSLRWVTLGGQYDWTAKVYPSFEIGSEQCPAFPPRLGTFIRELFGIEPQAAIVNYYTQGDTLSPHQDVAERSEADLVSISLGCTCVFYVGSHRLGHAPLPVLLHSGDVVVLGGPARRAFHGVGRVYDNTSPEYLWDAVPTERYASWIKIKRININVRQMF